MIRLTRLLLLSTKLLLSTCYVAIVLFIDLLPWESPKTSQSGEQSSSCGSLLLSQFKKYFNKYSEDALAMYQNTTLRRIVSCRSAIHTRTQRPLFFLFEFNMSESAAESSTSYRDNYERHKELLLGLVQDIINELDAFQKWGAIEDDAVNVARDYSK